MPSTCSSSAWQIASSCIANARLGRQHLVIELPRRSRFLRSHLLDGVADVDHDVLADRRTIVLEQKEAYVALDTLRAAAGEVAVDRDDLHGNAEAHGWTPRVIAPRPLI